MTPRQIISVVVPSLAAIAIAGAAGNIIGQGIGVGLVDIGDLISFVGAVVGAGVTVWGGATLARAQTRQQAQEALEFLRSTVSSVRAASEGASNPRERYAGYPTQQILDLLIADIEYITEADDVLDEGLRIAAVKPVVAIPTLHRVLTALRAEKDAWNHWFEEARNIRPDASVAELEKHLEWLEFHVRDRAVELCRRARLAGNALDAPAVEVADWVGEPPPASH